MRKHVALLATGLATLQPTLAQVPDARAVPTYESAGLYWSNPSVAATSGCEVRFRKAGAGAWTQGLALWFDARNNECRGSLVHLQSGTDYQVELNLPGQPTARSLSFRTWPDQRPVARKIAVPSGSATLTVTAGGNASGYVVYEGVPGAVLDAGNAAQFNVAINASYVIVRGLTLRGAQQDAIRIAPNVTDVVIEDNDISGWGRSRAPGLGVNLDSGIRAICAAATLERVTIQRNRIHDPRHGTNSWSDGHPEGPQATTFSNCGGNHVIRHNEMYSSNGNRFNDIIGGEDNFSTVGFPNADSDIYGNRLSHAWDDAIEAEGGNRNVRIWGNYIDNAAIGIATTVSSVGPVYAFRNVYNRSRELERLPLDEDARQELFKAGSDPSLGDGRRYLFHNTMLQAVSPQAQRTLGAGYGISGTGDPQPFNNTVSKNNIYHQWMDDWIVYRQPGAGNELANDMYNGIANVPVTNGIHAAPVYAAGHGWTSEANGRYQLAPGSPGYDAGARIANFNDAHSGAGPDVGAHEGGSAPMKFGIAASPGPAVPSTAPADVARPDFNGDGKPDLHWSNAASGATFLWYMNGPAFLSDAFVAAVDPAWRIEGVADFDRDGHPDIVWRNADSGASYVWYMDGPAFLADAFLFTIPPEWTIQGVADFNADGKADFLLRNVVSGNAFAWYFDNAAPIGDQFLFNIDPAWKVEAVGDLDADGQPDLVFRNMSSGLAFAWHTEYSGGTLRLGTSSAPMFSIDPKWEVAQLADWNGDTRPDFVFRNRETGVVFVWYANATALSGSDYVTQVDPAWQIVPRR